MESIVASAALHGKMVWTGKRHSDVIRNLADHFPNERPLCIVQGFVTSTERFVTRKEAGEIALKAGQVGKLHPTGQLFSEDLW